MRPPPSSRAYRTADRINAEQHFSLDLYLDMIGGYPHYIEAVRKASAALVYYDVKKGTRAPFPSAFDFIEECFGIKRRAKACALSRADRDWSVRLLRTAFKLRGYVNERIEDWPFFHVTCPKCGKRKIMVRVGMLEPLADEHPRMLSIHVDCTCKKFTTADYYAIEALALSEQL